MAGHIELLRHELIPRTGGTDAGHLGQPLVSDLLSVQGRMREVASGSGILHEAETMRELIQLLRRYWESLEFHREIVRFWSDSCTVWRVCCGRPIDRCRTLNGRGFSAYQGVLSAPITRRISGGDRAMAIGLDTGSRRLYPVLRWSEMVSGPATGVE